MILNTPVVFTIFNRPETTLRVFNEIAHAQPRTLFIIADGPRADRPDDVERVAQTRAIVEQIDWDCEVKRNYAETNMGMKARISSGLNWVFEIVEEAIVLEDDCLPHPTFFLYCEALLDYYRDSDRIMHISGSNLLSGAYSVVNSYYYTRYPHVWGWATWRRAWTLYDVNMTKWLEDPIFFLSRFEDPQEREFWRKAWDGVDSGQINSWAYPWVFACQAHDGLGINPVCNLVSNIGFGSEATYTLDPKGVGSGIPVEAISFPLQHPNLIQRDTTADRIIAELFFERRNILQDDLYKQTQFINQQQAVINRLLAEKESHIQFIEQQQTVINQLQTEMQSHIQSIEQQATIDQLLAEKDAQLELTRHLEQEILQLEHTIKDLEQRGVVNRLKKMLKSSAK